MGDHGRPDYGPADHGPAGHGRLLVIEHELDAPAGLLGPWAQARGMTLSVIHLGGGDRLPGRLPDCAGVVVLAAVFWWNRRRRDRFEREDAPKESDDR